jgi:hypothetical protein
VTKDASGLAGTRGEKAALGPTLVSVPRLPENQRSVYSMAESWKLAKASDVVVGDVVRTQSGDVVRVSRIEAAFMGNEAMLAFIEDTSERWYKRPARTDADLEILEEET